MFSVEITASDFLTKICHFGRMAILVLLSRFHQIRKLEDTFYVRTIGDHGNFAIHERIELAILIRSQYKGPLWVHITWVIFGPFTLSQKCVNNVHCRPYINLSKVRDISFWCPPLRYTKLWCQDFERCQDGLGPNPWFSMLFSAARSKSYEKLFK